MIKNFIYIMVLALSFHIYALDLSKNWIDCTITQKYGTKNVMRNNRAIATVAAYGGTINDLDCQITEEGLQIDTTKYFKNPSAKTAQLDFSYFKPQAELLNANCKATAEIKGNTAGLKGKIFFEGYLASGNHYHKYEGFTTSEAFTLVDITTVLPAKLGRLRARIDLSSAGIYTFKSVSINKVSNLDASIITNKWRVFLNPANYSDFNKMPRSLKGINVTAQDNVVDIAKAAGKLMPEKTALIFNEFNSPEDAEIYLGMSADWWMEVYLNGKEVYNTMKSKGNGTITFSPSDHFTRVSLKKGKNLLAVKVKSGSGGWKFCYGVPYHQNITFNRNDKWKRIDMSDLRVQKNSAIDLSNFTKGKMERLVIGKDGKLAKESTPDKPFRLFAFNGFSYWASQLHKAKDVNAWKAAIDEYVELIHRQGYNMNRTNNYGLSKWQTKDIQELDSDEARDRLHYVASRYKEKGIYIHMFLDDEFLWVKKGWKGHELKAMMLIGDPEVRQSWKNYTTKLLNSVNPYTNLAIKDDPVYACLEYQNEMGMALRPMTNPEIKKKVDKKFQEWLQKKYHDIYTLRMAWGNNNIKSFADIKVNISDPYSAQAKDYALHMNYLYRETADWFTKTIRKIGYKGLISQYSLTWKWHYFGRSWLNLGILESRYEYSDVAISNSYFAHPAGWFNKGAKVPQESSIASLADHWRKANNTRFIDRPFFQTEHNHCFWNQYKYEAGLIFPAYSALQGFDALTVHCNAIFWGQEHVNKPFLVGTSAVSRANQFLTACLFYRGDVSPARKKVAISLPQNANGYKTAKEAMRVEDRDKLSLITGFAVDMPWAPRPKGVTGKVKTDAVISPVKASTYKDLDQPGTIFEPANGRVDEDKILDILRHRNVIAKDNISNIKAGIYQSDTGEITLRQKEKLLKVVTAKTEAVALTAKKAEKLANLEVIASTENACIAVTAMDDKPLAKSRKMVLLYITRDANEGMEISGNQETLYKQGSDKLLLKCGKFSIKLKNSNAGRLHLYALSITGKRMQKIPYKRVGNQLYINIDTAKLKHGPTVFFELAQ